MKDVFQALYVKNEKDSKYLLCITETVDYDTHY